MASDSSQHDLTAGLSGQGSRARVPVTPAQPFVGFVGCSAAAWWIAPRRPARAMTIMASGCTGPLGLLLLADSQGWLGA